MYELAGDWCSGETNEECKAVLRSAYDNANISTGDFVKALMKIIKLSKELLSGAESTGDLICLQRSASTVNEIHCHVTLAIRMRISHAKSIQKITDTRNSYSFTNILVMPNMT